MASEESKVIGIEELCNILDIGKNTAYELLNNGEIDAFKCGSNWKIVRSAVDEYIVRKVAEHKRRPMVRQVKRKRFYN